MAYELYHTISFQNRVTGEVLIELFKKDGVPGTTVTELQGMYAKRQFLNGDGDKFDTIIASELTFGFRLPIGSPYTYNDFLVSFHDEWRVRLWNEGNIEFEGWLTPNEGTSRFRDLPYELELNATDGLGFLKNDALTKYDGTAFENTHTLISYIAGALAKTRLDLKIRTYCQIFEASTGDRNTDPTADMFKSIHTDYRTYQQDDTTMMSCYEALEKNAKRRVRSISMVGPLGGIAYRRYAGQRRPAAVVFRIHARGRIRI